MHYYLAFAIIALNVLWGASLHAETPCSNQVYVIDSDPQGTNVREAPNGHSKIIQVLPRDKEGGTSVKIIGFSNGWVHVNEFWDTTTDPKKINGWINARLLGTSSDVGGGVELYAQPTKTSQSIPFPSGLGFRLLSCQDDWIQVETLPPIAESIKSIKEVSEENKQYSERYKQFLEMLRKRKSLPTGWLRSHCSNPLTTCP